MKDKPYPEFFELLKDATDLLRDRPKVEADLIYATCKLTEEERCAIKMAYRSLYEKKIKR